MPTKAEQCPMCGEIVAQLTGFGVCSDCVDKDRELFDEVKSSMSLGQIMTIEDLSERSEVDAKHIRRWIKTGRLALAK